MTEHKFQAVFRNPHPDVQYAFNEVAVAADTAEEFADALGKVNGAAQAIYLAQETLRFAFVGGESVDTGVVSQPHANGPAVPQPAPQRTQPAQPQPPSCAHGPRSYVTGLRNGKPWAGWFCALPKGSPGACAPEWVSV